MKKFPTINPKKPIWFIYHKKDPKTYWGVLYPTEIYSDKFQVKVLGRQISKCAAWFPVIGDHLNKEGWIFCDRGLMYEELANEEEVEKMMFINALKE